MKTIGAALLAVGLSACVAGSPVESPSAKAPSSVMRTDSSVLSIDGMALFVREVAPSAPSNLPPVLLIHGAGPGGTASFDLPVPGYSLAEDLARAGYRTYMLDIRGWGRSARPPSLDKDARENPPAVTSVEAVSDIESVVAWIRSRNHGTAIALMGWATGGHWAGMYTASHPESVSHLVMLNSLYGTSGPWPLRERLEEPDRPGEFSRNTGAYALRDKESLLRAWTASIPALDKASWRDPRVADAYVAVTLAGDPTSLQRHPPTMRAPAGPLLDSYRMAGGTKFWDASGITAPALILRSELDFWSRPEDVEALRRDLKNALRVRIVTIPGATHHVMFDRPEHGRERLLLELCAFFADREPPPAQPPGDGGQG